MSDSLPHSGSPRVLIAAFEGWSDAGAATTTVLQHLGELIDAEVIHSIGVDGFVDFQVHRPKVSFDEDGNRVLDWPETRLYGTVQKPGEAADESAETIRRIDGSRVTDLYLLAGVEPARDWSAFADEVVELTELWGIDTVVLLGSYYSDAPHSRPIAVTLSSEDAGLRSRSGATRSDYEGAVGVITVIELALAQAGVPVLALWAQVPHYVHSAPSPKATLAMLDKLEELLDVVIPRGELLSDANEWEANINRIAATDEDMARYIRGLEEARDAASAPEATGEAIAYEFEKFLNIDAPTEIIENATDAAAIPEARDSPDANDRDQDEPDEGAKR